MKKVYRVLLFDDRPQVRIYLRGKLEAMNMEVFTSKSVYEATDIWESEKDNLDAIVFDVMMPSSGLSDELRKQAQGGLLTGWIWLWQQHNPDSETYTPIGDKCVVIYSAYLDDFKKYLESESPGAAERAFAGRLLQVYKGDLDSENKVVSYLVKDRETRDPDKVGRI